jgi:curved DNA-binding protein CbpA
MQSTDLYAELGVPVRATADEIHHAYLALARRYHPDVNRAPDAEEHFKRISAAYATLGDPEKRARYDLLGPTWQQHYPIHRAQQGDRESHARVDEPPRSELEDERVATASGWRAFDIRRASLACGAAIFDSALVALALMTWTDYPAVAPAAVALAGVVSLGVGARLSRP